MKWSDKMFRKQQKPVHDLRKQKTTEDYMFEINRFLGQNFYIIALAVILICLALFVFVCFKIVGYSSTESGLVYNQMENVICILKTVNY